MQARRGWYTADGRPHVAALPLCMRATSLHARRGSVALAWWHQCHFALACAAVGLAPAGAITRGPTKHKGSANVR